MFKDLFSCGCQHPSSPSLTLLLLYVYTHEPPLATQVVDPSFLVGTDLYKNQRQFFFLIR